MARNSAANCRFLVSRQSRASDVKSFAYFRRWTEDIAPFVQGQVVLDWKRQIFDISKKQQIKIALSISDISVARDRWATVHARVEQILAQAHHAFLLSKNTVADESARQSDEIRIPDEQLQLMAEQIRFDMISNADRQLEGDTTVSPVQRILERAAKVDDPNFAGLSSGDIETEARLVEQKIAQRFFATRNIDAYEFAIQETELDLPAPNGFTTKDIGTVPSIEGFVPNEGGYVELDRGKITSRKLLHSPAHQALENNGYNLKDNITNCSQLAWKLWRGEVETRADLVDLAKGRRIEVPSKRPELKYPQKIAKRTLVDLFQNWIVTN